MHFFIYKKYIQYSNLYSNVLRWELILLSVLVGTPYYLDAVYLKYYASEISFLLFDSGLNPKFFFIVFREMAS